MRDAFTASTVRHSNTFLRSVIHKVTTHLQGWLDQPMRRTIHLKCVRKRKERGIVKNFRRLRRAEVTSSLRSQNTNFPSGPLRSPGLILPNLTKLIHLFGFWVGVLINSLNRGSWSALLQNIRAESLG